MTMVVRLERWVRVLVAGRARRPFLLLGPLLRLDLRRRGKAHHLTSCASIRALRMLHWPPILKKYAPEERVEGAFSELRAEGVLRS